MQTRFSSSVAETTVVEGTVLEGEVKLDKPVDLPDNCRVSVVVQPLSSGTWDPVKATAALEEFKKLIAEKRLYLGGETFNREELYESD